MSHRRASSRILAKREPDPILRRIDAVEFASGSVVAFVFVVVLTAARLERPAPVIWTFAIILVAIVVAGRVARTMRRRRIRARLR
jgi:archaellum biogenesis protein FlaJ (TadC family)